MLLMLLALLLGGTLRFAPSALAAPSIIDFAPTSGAQGDVISVYGGGFSGATAVTFNGTNASSYSVNSDTALVATVPAGATTGPICVTSGGSTGCSSSNFTIGSSGGTAPSVTDFTPTTEGVTQPVMIEGAHFTGASSVTFNGTSASFQVTTDGAISTSVPSGATSGLLCVTTPQGQGCSSSSFTVGTAITSTPTGHDNTTAPWHDYKWTHGGPNSGNFPGNGNSGTGYYYLKMYAAGPVVFCEVYSAGDWLIQLEDANKNVFMQLTTSGAGGRVYMTNATTGALYQCRISDIGSQPQKDYAELNSGALGDTHTSDCGGPGPVWDPNFDAPPMEPAPTSGMPTNGCDHRSAVAYVSTDPRVSPPAQEGHDLGAISGNHTYTFTTTRAGDLTAFAFVASQGTSATITITNSSGQTINGVKWGDEMVNPKTMNQEFVEADAGVQPAGTYHVVYSGPAASGHDMWALVGNQ
jgi:hypothetical protein